MHKIVYDIGASNIKFALMTDEGEILARNKVPTPRDSLEGYLSQLSALAEPYLRQADGVAISTNGRMDPDGDTYRAYTLECLVGVNLRKEMESRLHLPVVIENDGMAATIGEWWKGAGRGTSHMLGFVIGSGLGGGLILNGKPFYGAHRNSAMVFGQLSTCDPMQETYVLSGIQTVFPMLLYQASAAKNRSLEPITGPEFFQMVEEGDPVAQNLLDGYCRAIAVTIYNNATMLDLDAVVLTGGLSQQDRLIAGVEKALKSISEKCLQFEGVDLETLGVHVDKSDFEVRLRRGELALDANLYGALYQLLNRK